MFIQKNYIQDKKEGYLSKKKIHHIYLYKYIKNTIKNSIKNSIKNTIKILNSILKNI